MNGLQIWLIRDFYLFLFMNRLFFWRILHFLLFDLVLFLFELFLLLFGLIFIVRKKCKIDPLTFTFFHFNPLTFSFVNLVLQLLIFVNSRFRYNSVTAAIKPTKTTSFWMWFFILFFLIQKKKKKKPIYPRSGWS